MGVVVAVQFSVCDLKFIGEQISEVFSSKERLEDVTKKVQKLVEEIFESSDFPKEEAITQFSLLYKKIVKHFKGKRQAGDFKLTQLIASFLNMHTVTETNKVTSNLAYHGDVLAKVCILHKDKQPRELVRQYTHKILKQASEHYHNRPTYLLRDSSSVEGYLGVLSIYRQSVDDGEYKLDHCLISEKSQGSIENKIPKSAIPVLPPTLEEISEYVSSNYKDRFLENTFKMDQVDQNDCIKVEKDAVKLAKGFIELIKKRDAFSLLEFLKDEETFHFMIKNCDLKSINNIDHVLEGKTFLLKKVNEVLEECLKRDEYVKMNNSLVMGSVTNAHDLMNFSKTLLDNSLESDDDLSQLFGIWGLRFKKDYLDFCEEIKLEDLSNNSSSQTVFTGVTKLLNDLGISEIKDLLDRGIFNRSMLVAYIKATGLPVSDPQEIDFYEAVFKTASASFSAVLIES